MLRQKQELVCENVELCEEQELQGEILGNHQQSLNSRQAKKENPKESHKWALANKL